jgi:hypothetical protein
LFLVVAGPLLRELSFLASLPLRVLALYALLPLGRDLGLGGLFALTTRSCLGLLTFVTTGGLELTTTGLRLRRGSFGCRDLSGLLDDVLDWLDIKRCRILGTEGDSVRYVVALELGDDRTCSQDLTCGGRPFF